MSLYKKTKENQYFFIGTGQVFGVQSVDASFQAPVEELKFIGMDECVLIPNGPNVGNFEVSQFLITDDLFLQYTGEFAISGYLVKSKTDYSQNFSFTSGYLTNYSIQCSIGSIPEVRASIQSFGKIGNIATSDVPGDIANSPTDFDLKIADPGSISINIDDFSTNRVTSFDLSIAAERTPVYEVGSRTPSEVKTNYPLPVSLSFQIEVDDYACMNGDEYICSELPQDIQLTIKDFQTQTNLQVFNLKKMKKVSESVLSEISNNTSVSMQYRGYIGR